MMDQPTQWISMERQSSDLFRVVCILSTYVNCISCGIGGSRISWQGDNTRSQRTSQPEQPLCGLKVGKQCPKKHIAALTCELHMCHQIAKRTNKPCQDLPMFYANTLAAHSCTSFIGDAVACHRAQTQLLRCRICVSGVSW